MRMLASQARKRAGDLANCVIETFRMPPYLARLRVEDRCNGTKQTLVLWCPEIDGKRSLIATEEQGRGYDRADSAPIVDERVLRDCHLIRVADAQHFDSDQLWRNHNCVPPIAG